MAPVETEYSRELQKRIEAGRHRVAEMMGETYVPLPQIDVIDTGLTRARAILRGRERARPKVTEDSPTKPTR